MTKQRYKMSTSHGPMIMGCEPSGVPGLVIHRDFFDGKIGEGWTVAHERSGLAGPRMFPSKENARSCAQALGQVFDWTQDQPAIAAEPGLGAKVDAIAKQFGGRRVTDGYIHRAEVRGK